MTLLAVPYTLEVLAVVDTDEGRVDRVLEVRENLAQNPLGDVMNWSPDYGHSGRGDIVEGALAEQAREIAEDAEWPAWDAL